MLACAHNKEHSNNNTYMVVLCVCCYCCCRRRRRRHRRYRRRCCCCCCWYCCWFVCLLWMAAGCVGTSIWNSHTYCVHSRRVRVLLLSLSLSTSICTNTHMYFAQRAEHLFYVKNGVGRFSRHIKYVCVCVCMFRFDRLFNHRPTLPFTLSFPLFRSHYVYRAYVFRRCFYTLSRAIYTENCIFSTPYFSYV